MTLRRQHHIGAVDEPSTSKETSDDCDTEGDEHYISYIMHLMVERRLMRNSIEKRHRQGATTSSARWRSSVALESPLAELDQRVMDDMSREETCGSPRRASTSRQAEEVPGSPARLSPIEVTVDTEAAPSAAPSAPSNSLLSANADSGLDQAAKHEAMTLRRVEELRRSGLWSAQRLPLCVEPPRNKTHWDYVLEEMKWMATDFRMERQFKRNVARKIAFAIQKQRKDLEMEKERAQMRSIKEGKRICASIAKMIRDFWQSVDKVVEHRAQEILEAKKRKALDAHMAFIVGEADKLSSIVQEGLTQDRASKTPSVTSDGNDDADFCGSESESDDEMTIEREEAAMQEQGRDDVQEEVSALNKEADQDIDDLLASLPPEYLASLGVQLPSNSAGRSGSPADSEGEVETSAVKERGRDTKADKVRTRDAEEIEEGSKAKRPKIEEASDEDSGSGRKSDDRPSSSVEAGKVEEDDMSVDEGPNRTQTNAVDLEGTSDGRGMLESVDYAKLNSVSSDERQKELANIAEAALKFQPKGYTLETTQVKTTVPFLIRGTLREYQMVGLDWLVTLYEKNLNGILADEMGLGKTIQTIALLAHLACCESIWGPHLIIVPTSVILNWEMELKKWCPAFKILTYFGSQKDRAEKRKGWMKPNTFHVCITSYKTVTTDIRAFKKRTWQYLILDEAQNIKNFKSQRWQALLNVRARRRLLLTGTPLQNSLMELWSLMHFLMPAIFASHDDFKDWFSNPLTGMMEGSVEFNAPLVQQLHKVLRPFILRRLKSEVEKQLPKKTEHVIKCSLSKRQRYLYDDFMSRRSTRDNLKSGNVLSVLNIVMQLRKCCNHPNLFEPRSVESPMCVHQLRLSIPGLVLDLNEKEFGRDIPEIFDLRKRFTGVSSATVGRAPLVTELAESCTVRPPVVPGFRLHRPVASSAGIPSAAHSAEIASVVDVSAAELQRAGFAQDEMVLVVRNGEDTDNALGNNTGAPVPMRVRVGDGRLVLDADGFKQHEGGARLCQVVTGANGEKTLREVTRRLADAKAGGNAPVPVSQVANPAPAAIAAMPGGAASAASTASSSKPNRVVYGQPTKKPNVNVHPFLRCTTSVSTAAPLTVSTAARGFHYNMQNGGVHESETNESIVEIAASLSPPLKRRRVMRPPKEQRKGQFADLVPKEVLRRKEEDKKVRLRRIVERFECQQRPFYSHQLISLLKTSVADKFDLEAEIEHRDSRSGRICFDVRDTMNEWVENAMKRFWIWVNPAVTQAPSIEPTSSGRGYLARALEQQFSSTSRELLSTLHPLTHKALVASQLHFPELRLIEYDCGKLQALSRLLRRLYALKHRCLIFTQMSKMLDVLQAFLSYHGYQYFRLDGTTGIEQRQAMMERFNADPKIFCFILSTRSGGVGVNLTGADTVIFYDSDWNPTMDAQAQDRCHRIGQTRNVTIFRLISEKTIEENILRKANQKRRLGEMAIDDAGFTPEFFKQSDNIRDLFDGDVEVGDIVVEERPKNQKDVEKAMAVLEDEQDVTAAKMLIAETNADKAEFDETRNVENSGAYRSCLDKDEPMDEKYIELISQLKPIERYAVNFLEAEYKPEFDEEVREAEAMIGQKREEWVKAHNKALSNGDADAEHDENSSRLDDEFYGAGMLLDEVRSRRKSRVTASGASVAPRAAPSRHSVRLAVPPQQKQPCSPRKSLSGRRLVEPNSVTASALSPSHMRSPPPAPVPQRSAAQTAARSVVRKAAARASASRRKRSTTTENGSHSPSASPAGSPSSNDLKKRRQEEQAGTVRRSLPSDKKPLPSAADKKPLPTAADKKPLPTAADKKPLPSPESTTPSEKTLKRPSTASDIPQQKPTMTTESPVTSTRPPAVLTSSSVCIRPSTIVGSVLTTPGTSTSGSTSSPHRVLPSSPFKSPLSPQTRFPVRTLSRHSQLPAPSTSLLPAVSPQRSSIQTSPVRLPVRVLQSPTAASRQPTSRPAAINGPPIRPQPSSSLLVQRPGIPRVAVSVANSVPRQRFHTRYEVVSRSSDNVAMVMPTTVRQPVMPVRRVIVQARNGTPPSNSASPAIQRPGLGEYERPRLYYRHRSTGHEPTNP